MDPWSRMIASAVDAVAPRVVSVSATDPRETQVAFASGVCLDARHVITHARLYTPGDRLSVAFPDGQRFAAELVTADPLYFLAVLRIQGQVEFGPPEIAPDEDLRPGVLCLALGNPLRSEAGLSLGVISAPDRTVYRPERFPVDGLILTDAAVRVQDIGGPLVSLEGRLLGINATPGLNGVASGVQARVVLRLVEQMLRYGRATHPWLGFSGQTEIVPPTIAALLQVPVARGVAVADVVGGGPGERAGVRAFDVVVRADGQDVESVGAIRRVLAVHRPGEDALITVLRGGELRDLHIPVEEIPRLSPMSWQDPSG